MLCAETQNLGVMSGSIPGGTPGQGAKQQKPGLLGDPQSTLQPAWRLSPAPLP
jgi:hypothetical protein